MAQTKYIHLNLKEVKNVKGEVNNLVNPPLTPYLTVCLPFAYQITERSKMALVGETAKAVMHPANIFFRVSLSSKGSIQNVVIDFILKFNDFNKNHQYRQFVIIHRNNPYIYQQSNVAHLLFNLFVYQQIILSSAYQTQQCNQFNIIFKNSKMNQRHYSPDQIKLNSRFDGEQKTNKKLREGGSTTKLMESTTRYCQEEVIVGDYRYKPSEEIGAGYSSRVYRALGKDKLQYAIKVIDMKKFSSSGLQMLENQIEILRKLNHPNIIKLYYVQKTQTHTYLVTELCKQGDLLQYMAKRGRLGEQAAASIMGEVIESVKYLMKMGVIHRDIKPANVLRGDKIWKLADFGFSINGNQEVRTKQNVGTPLYMPIQSLLKNIYSPESDIFAVGVMYYELLIGITPWECRSQKQLIKKLASVPFSVPEKFKLSSHIKYLLEKMCSVDKNMRMHKEEFCSINLKNFVSLLYFNDPHLTSKKIDQNKKEVNSPSNLKKSKSKNKNSKDKQKDIKSKIDKQYKLGRRKKSNDKAEPRKKSNDKQVVSVKAYGIKEDGSSLKTINAGNLIAEGQSIDRFQIINQKIFMNQLDYCRFMYYLIQNCHYMPIPEDKLKRIILIIFKHMVKNIKQLSDIKTNYYKLPNWDTFKMSFKYKNIIPTIQEYCEKYEKQYLKHLKQSQISVIKEVNQKFSELGSIDALSLVFYRKLQGLIESSLKNCISSIEIQDEQISQSCKYKIEATKSLLRYYRWIQMNVKDFENYALQKNSKVLIVKNYKNSETSKQQYIQLIQEIKNL